MTSKTIVIHIPTGMSNVKIIKEIDFDETNSIQIEITNDLDDAENICNENIFCCFQHKQKTVFYPMEYAYIESTSNHYSQWHPIDPNKPVLSIYTHSLEGIDAKLCKAGLN